jgi:hypothetical protein
MDAEGAEAGDGEVGSAEAEEVKAARREEIAALEAQLAARSAHSSVQNSKQASKQGSKQTTGRLPFATDEEIQSAADQAAGLPRPSQRAAKGASSRAQRSLHASAHPSARGSAQASARNLAASPSAAAAAAPSLDDELAGLDDDLDEGSEFDGSDFDSEYGDPDAAGDEEEEVRTIEDVLRAKEEREHLIEVNKIRQRQIALILEREKASHPSSSQSAGKRGAEEKSSEGAPPEQVRSEYIKNLENLNLLWDELESKRETAEEQIDRLTSKLDAADAHCTELSDSFKAFKREVAKEARYSRTGRPIKLKRILAFEAQEADMEREVARVRLRHINLLNELRSLEEAVRSKERLAEGLHLIDFEQLKIENQTLNEKIEERNDELHKLKKKTTTTVQVLTHIKEKLQCVREENAAASSELSSLNQAVQNLRDTLTRTKHARDEARSENQALKQKQGFIGSDLLVSDFENRKVRAEKEKHSNLEQRAAAMDIMEEQMADLCFALNLLLCFLYVQGDIEVLRSEVEQLKARWRSLTALSQKAQAMERTQMRMEEQQSTQRANHYATVKFGSSGLAGRR